MNTKTKSGASESQYLTAAEAAAFLGYQLSYFYQLTSRNKIPYYNPTGRKILIKRTELEAWITKGRVKSNEELTQNI